ncbi:MAG TPA: ABC transporter permease [Armatimonadota bacterium]|jgi:putative ABC transport system permease protein
MATEVKRISPPAPEQVDGNGPFQMPKAIPAGGLNPVSVIMAVRGLGANKLRAFLTMLGIIIGVGAVIIAIAIGQGSREAVSQSLRALGTNVITVFSGQQRRGGISMGVGSSVALKPEDAEAIVRGCPSVIRVNPSVNRNAQIKYLDNNDSVAVYGQGADYPVVSNHIIRIGRYFGPSDVKTQQRVAILGSNTWQDLFNGQPAVGKAIRIAGQRFEVIGVFQSKGGAGFRNPDDGVYVPYTTAMRRLFGMDNIQTLTCQARTEALMPRAQAEIESVLRKAHRLPDSAENDFRIFNQADLAQTQNEQQDTFSALITYLAIVSLVVGGVGIMNIMLVSVTERTREIGVRKAIGAKRRHILTQFLLEALFLSLIGGLLGVAFGVGGAKLVERANNWTVVLAPATILMAFSFSAVVGGFFGFYPAWKASRLNPIDALRYE